MFLRKEKSSLIISWNKSLFSKELSLKASITKNKILNLATTPINDKKRCNNAVEMERNALTMLIDSEEKNDFIALELVLVKRIFKESLSMFNVDDFMKKTAKKNVLQSFSRQPQFEVPSVYISLDNMGLISRFSSPSSDNRDAKTRNETDYLRRDYLDQVCSMVYSRHYDAISINLMNDSYTFLTSIKDDEVEH